jgi:hypothetical protein
LPEWGNTAKNISIIQVPAGEQIFVGAASEQVKSTIHLIGGGSQYFFKRRIPNSWIVK